MKMIQSWLVWFFVWVGLGLVQGQEGEENLDLIRAPYSQSWELLREDEIDDGEDSVVGGLFEYLSSETGGNPALEGKVVVTGSGLSEKSSPLHGLVGGDSSARVLLSGGSSPRFQISLVDLEFLPTSYTLIHPDSVEGDYLRNWALSGSQDGEEWVLLSAHEDEGELGEGVNSATWDLEMSLAFQHFRLELTGQNSSGELEIVLAHLEFHGTLYGNDLSAVESREAIVREFGYDGPGDGENEGQSGLLAFLSAGGGRDEPVNPALRGLISVEASSLADKAEPPWKILAPEKILLETGEDPAGSVTFRLAPGNRIAMSAYRLDRESGSSEPPFESWILEGSNNGANWEVLHEGQSEDAESEDELGFFYLVDPMAEAVAFREIRLRLAGSAAEEGLPIRLPGIEFYGTVKGGRALMPEQFDPVCEPMQFTYEADFDGRGIVAYFATSGGREEYRNPALRGLIGTSSSVLLSDSEPSFAILGNEAVRCVTIAQQDAWFEVDFGKNRVRPTHYSLRHYVSFDSEALRNWKLQGSNDGETWLDLREHVGDASLTREGDTASWVIANPAEGLGFSKFRVLQTGLNSNNHYNLALSGFEIYGTLCPEESLRPIIEKEQTFDYQSDFDGGGVVSFLATKGGNKGYENPAQLGLMEVRASSLTRDSAPASAAVGDQVVRCVTSPVPDSFFEFDFKSLEIQPTHYTLRHYLTWDTEALRNWVFEGSNGDGTWFVLDERLNDVSLSSKGDTATFQIPGGLTLEYYRKFRVRQIGRNSNQHWYLALSGFEIYGSARGVVSQEDLPEPEIGFEFEGTFDGNGLVSHLATNGRTEGYRNPVDRGLVRVTSSPLMNDSEPAKAILGNEAVRCVTKPITPSSFVIEFPGILIRPAYYSLRHYSTWDTEALRNWRLEGSVDGVSWTVLRNHVDDDSLNAAGSEASWEITGDASRQNFSFFRVIQSGPNSNQHNYLALSGFEIYGVLASGDELYPDGIAQPEPGRGQVFVNDDDPFGGIVDYLGTLNGTQAFENPGTTGQVVVSSSPLLPDSEPVAAITGKDAVRCVTRAVRDSWMKVDFGNLRVFPTAYSLRHYSSWDTEALRNWQLEGSNDDLNWTVLSTHINDSALNGRGAVHTWQVPGAKGTYRYFRVIQTGRNSNGHFNLALSGVEFFGELYAADLSDNPSYNQWAYEAGLAPGGEQRIGFDANGDGMANLGHFAFGSSPVERGLGRAVLKSQLVMLPQVDGPDQEFFAFTFAVRTGALRNGKELIGDGLVYRLRTSLDLQLEANLGVSELFPALSGELPVLPVGYQYRTFYLSEKTEERPRAFISLSVESQ